MWLYGSESCEMCNYMYMSGVEAYLFVFLLGYLNSGLLNDAIEFVFYLSMLTLLCVRGWKGYVVFGYDIVVEKWKLFRFIGIGEHYVLLVVFIIYTPKITPSVYTCISLLLFTTLIWCVYVEAFFLLFSFFFIFKDLPFPNTLDWLFILFTSKWECIRQSKHFLYIIFTRLSVASGMFSVY